MFSAQVFLLTVGTWLLAESAAGGILQVGTIGGITKPLAGGPATNSIPALTVIPENFGALYDSISGLVGGGDVAGDLYYAFTARSLDRTGDTRLPAGSIALQPYGPANSFAGGQLIGSSPSLSVGQALGHYGHGYNIGVGGTGGNNYFNAPRVDMAPARVALFEVHLRFNATDNDSALITMSLYDNLPHLRQPIASDGVYTQSVISAHGNFAFDKFQFTSGHTDSAPARWSFSNVVFAENEGEAAEYLLAHPFSTPNTIIQVGKGGITDPENWSEGDPATDAIDVNIATNDFGDLYDSASGTIGGGAVIGHLYYAFTARSLDRAGSVLLPAGSTAGQPFYPSNAFAGGQLVRSLPVLGISQGFGSHGVGCYTGSYGSPKIDFNPRIDMCPARVMLYEVDITFTPSGNDNAKMVMYVYDNLPEGQWQPSVTNTPDYTYTNLDRVNKDLAFNLFQFISGHKDSRSARWLFSDVVFASTPGTAKNYILDPPPPPPPPGTVIMIL
ncbi:MAG: hypothetical protein PHO37_17120 [Kiritimatiellae bacterium]|nr:hypothetical protein [Kiritimatiellia bacterium]